MSDGIDNGFGDVGGNASIDAGSVGNDSGMTFDAGSGLMDVAGAVMDAMGNAALGALGAVGNAPSAGFGALVESGAVAEAFAGATAAVDAASAGGYDGGTETVAYGGGGSWVLANYQLEFLPANDASGLG